MQKCMSPHEAKEHMEETEKKVESIDVNKVIFNVGNLNLNKTAVNSGVRN